MFKNVAGQKLVLQVVDSATGLPKTGDAANLSAYVSLDAGSVALLTDTSATELSSTNLPGIYWWDLAQAETNGNRLTFGGKSTTSGVTVIAIFVDTTPPNFNSMVINSLGAISINTSMKQNQALAKYPFLMTDSTSHFPITGKTVTPTRSIDGGSFAGGTLSAVTEVANGIYTVDLAAGDMNGRCIVLHFTASGCDDQFITLVTEP